jgi:hypothetical protein
MSESYTRDNYSPSVLPGGLHKDVQAIVTGAVGVGWTVHVKHISATLQAPHPHEDQTIRFSASAPPKNLNSIKRKIAHYADPALLPTVAEPVKEPVAVTAEPKESIMAEETRQSRLQRITEARAKRKAEAEAERQRADTERKQKVTAIIKAEAEAAETESGPDAKFEFSEPTPSQWRTTRKAVVTEPKPDRYVVSEEPMIALAGGQRTTGEDEVVDREWGYESETTNERLWSDGSVDYTCRQPGCDFSTPHRTGSRGHWRMHVERGEATPIGSRTRTTGTFVVERQGDLWVRAGSPRKRRPPVAKKQERPTLTDEQIVSQIRTLVGGDDLAARLIDYEDKVIPDLKSQLANAEARASAAEAAAARITSEWEALSDLIATKMKGESA